MPKITDVTAEAAAQSKPPQSPHHQERKVQNSTNTAHRKPRRSFSVSEIPVTGRIKRAPSQKTQQIVSLTIPDRETLIKLITRNPEMLSTLSMIDMSWTNITTADLIKLLETIPNLKNLIIWHCESLQSLYRVPATLLMSLEKIDLSFTPISSRDVQTLLSATPHLRHIDLWYCQNIKEGALSKLPADSLLFLLIARLGALKLKMPDIQTLVEAAPHLTEINLTDCPYITKGDLQTIPEQIKVIW